MSEVAVPVDIVMVIDNSASMSDEIGAVRSYINNLSNEMEALSVDYHFVMISLKNGDNVALYGIQVPAPLGTSSRFMHLDEKIGSWHSLKAINSHYGNYSFFLRNNATLNFIIVTDDNSDLSYSKFKNQMAGHGKPNFKMHAIIGLSELDPGIANVGEEYITGIEDTGGVQLDITTPTSEWGVLFNQLSNNIIEHVSNDSYQISGNPIIHDENSPENSFSVYINEDLISPVNNWVYDQVNNSIIFLNMELLDDNSIIEVDYDQAP